MLAAAAWFVCVLAPVLQGARAPSLEELLQRARAQQATLELALTEKLSLILERHDAVAQPIPSVVRDALVLDLAQLGEAAGGLLIARIDPGAEGGLVETSRADLCARALIRFDLAAHVATLLERLERASPKGVAPLLMVLTQAGQPERVHPRLRELFDRRWRDVTKEPESTIRDQFLLALLADDAVDQSFVDGLLDPSRPDLARGTLESLSKLAAPQAIPSVRKLFVDTAQAARLGRWLLDYFKSVPDATSASDVQALLELAAHAQTDRSVKRDLLESLGDFAAANPSEVRRSIERIATDGDVLLTEAAQVALARAGDRAARRAVLNPYDKDVDANPRQAAAWTRRAEVLLRMNDPDAAIRDFKQAIDLAKSELTLRTDVPLGMARAYARKARFKETAEWLRKVHVTAAKLDELTRSNEFAAFRKSKYGQELFGS